MSGQSNVADSTVAAMVKLTAATMNSPPVIRRMTFPPKKLYGVQS
jgi:hypothetical protein